MSSNSRCARVMTSPNLSSQPFWLQPFESMHDSHLKSPTGQPSPNAMTQQLPQELLMQTMLDMGTPQLQLKSILENETTTGLKSGLHHYRRQSQEELLVSAASKFMIGHQDAQQTVRMNDIHPSMDQPLPPKQQEQAHLTLDSYQMIEIEGSADMSAFDEFMESQNHLGSLPRRSNTLNSGANTNSSEASAPDEMTDSFLNYRSASEPHVLSLPNMYSVPHQGGIGRKDSVASIRSDVSTGSQRSTTITASIGSRQFIYHDNGERKFECPRCDKKYRNMNGLKYHLSHVHAVLEGIPLEVLLEDRKRELEGNKSRPFECPVEGCSKRYKNPNGLKYHLEHGHLNDDEIFLSPVEAPLNSAGLQEQPTMIETFLLDTGLGNVSLDSPTSSGSSPRRPSLSRRGSNSSVIRRKTLLNGNKALPAIPSETSEDLHGFSSGEHMPLIVDFAHMTHQQRPLTPEENIMNPYSFMGVQADSAVFTFSEHEKRLQQQQLHYDHQNIFLSPDSQQGDLTFF